MNRSEQALDCKSDNALARVRTHTHTLQPKGVARVYVVYNNSKLLVDDLSDF